GFPAPIAFGQRKPRIRIKLRHIRGTVQMVLVVELSKPSGTVRGILLLRIRFDAAIKTGKASAEFFSVFGGALPLFFVRDQRPIFFAQSGNLQFVAVGIGKIDAPFSRRAQAVLGTKIALAGSAAGGD